MMNKNMMNNMMNINNNNNYENYENLNYLLEEKLLSPEFWADKIRIKSYVQSHINNSNLNTKTEIDVEIIFHEKPEIYVTKSTYMDKFEIYLPYMPILESHSYAKQIYVRAACLKHELAHILFSTYNKSIRDKYLSDPQIYSLYVWLEDARVEYLFSNIFKGTKLLFSNVVKELCGSEEQQKTLNELTPQSVAYYIRLRMAGINIININNKLYEQYEILYKKYFPQLVQNTNEENIFIVCKNIYNEVLQIKEKQKEQEKQIEEKNTTFNLNNDKKFNNNNEIINANNNNKNTDNTDNNNNDNNNEKLQNKNKNENNNEDENNNIENNNNDNNDIEEIDENDVEEDYIDDNNEDTNIVDLNEDIYNEDIYKKLQQQLLIKNIDINDNSVINFLEFIHGNKLINLNALKDMHGIIIPLYDLFPYLTGNKGACARSREGGKTYLKVINENKHLINSVVNFLKLKLQIKNKKHIKKFQLEGEVDQSQIFQVPIYKNPRVFMITKKIEDTKHNVSILIDISSSMSNFLIHESIITCIILVEVCKRLGISYEINFFTDIAGLYKLPLGKKASLQTIVNILKRANSIDIDSEISFEIIRNNRNQVYTYKKLLQLNMCESYPPAKLLIDCRNINSILLSIKSLAQPHSLIVENVLGYMYNYGIDFLIHRGGTPEVSSVLTIYNNLKNYIKTKNDTTLFIINDGGYNKSEIYTIKNRITNINERYFSYVPFNFSIDKKSVSSIYNAENNIENMYTLYIQLLQTYRNYFSEIFNNHTALIAICEMVYNSDYIAELSLDNNIQVDKNLIYNNSKQFALYVDAVLTQFEIIINHFKTNNTTVLKSLKSFITCTLFDNSNTTTYYDVEVINKLKFADYVFRNITNYSIFDNEFITTKNGMLLLFAIMFVLSSYWLEKFDFCNIIYRQIIRTMRQKIRILGFGIKSYYGKAYLGEDKFMYIEDVQAMKQAFVQELKRIW